MCKCYVLSDKIIGKGLATIGLIVAGIGIGVVFGVLILSVSINSSLGGQLFAYVILGIEYCITVFFTN